MRTLEGLKRRIKTTNSLKGIVSGMKTLATVSLEGYSRSAAAGSAYLRNVELALEGVLKERPASLVPPREDAPQVLALIVGSDQGLVGRFNKQVVLHAFDFLSRRGIGASDATLLAAGKSLSAKIVAEGRDIDTLFGMPGSARMIPSVAKKIIMRLGELTGGFSRGGNSSPADAPARVYIFHNRREGDGFKSQSTRLLPVDERFLRSLGARRWPSKNVPFHRAERPALLSAFVRELLFIGVYRVISESLSAEHFIRMMTMKNAEKNIGDQLDAMNLEYRTRRQAEITEELIDVVAGAEVLRGKA
ncbi:MAG: F0F1 ATP synthase subunit gamma [Rickettsiales bacterium]|jgi:F-type H+-transporting ATPase subunit gamma|nr:F0F1 ATP synthase subunit gamma [Rickettsiales bacterium]